MRRNLEFCSAVTTKSHKFRYENFWGADYKTLNIADWTFSIAYGRRLWKNLDLGIAVHGLYRELDQTGWGFRSDLGLSYTFPKNFSASAGTFFPLFRMLIIPEK